MSEALVSIIGGGWSLRALHDTGRDRIPGVRIGVNDAFVRMKCDMGVTMDRLWIEHRWNDAARIRLPLHVRETALRNIELRPLWLRTFLCDHETEQLSEDPGHLNGASSGECAINLAYQMRPERIILWGFDMCRAPDGSAYWYPAYPWSKRPSGSTPPGEYERWSHRMEAVQAACDRAGIKLLNASAHSAITCIEKVDPWSLLTRTK